MESSDRYTTTVNRSSISQSVYIDICHMLLHATHNHIDSAAALFRAAPLALDICGHQIIRVIVFPDPE